MKNLCLALFILLISCSPVEPEQQKDQPILRSEADHIIGLIVHQIQKCWNIPVKKSGEGIAVKLDVDIDKEGKMTFVGFLEPEKYQSDDFYRLSADSARNAVLDPKCNPLKELPPLDKYEMWSKMTIVFDSTSIFKE